MDTSPAQVSASYEAEYGPTNGRFLWAHPSTFPPDLTAMEDLILLFNNSFTPSKDGHRQGDEVIDDKDDRVDDRDDQGDQDAQNGLDDQGTRVSIIDEADLVNLIRDAFELIITRVSFAKSLHRAQLRTDASLFHAGRNGAWRDGPIQKAYVSLFSAQSRANQAKGKAAEAVSSTSVPSSVPSSKSMDKDDLTLTIGAEDYAVALTSEWKLLRQPRVYSAEYMGETFREAFYQGLWYLSGYHYLCGTQLGVVAVSMRFMRVWRSDQRTVFVEVSDDMAMRSGDRRIKVKDLQANKQFWLEEPINDFFPKSTGFDEKAFNLLWTTYRQGFQLAAKISKDFVPGSLATSSQPPAMVSNSIDIPIFVSPELDDVDVDMDVDDVDLDEVWASEDSPLDLDIVREILGDHDVILLSSKEFSRMVAMEMDKLGDGPVRPTDGEAEMQRR